MAAWNRFSLERIFYHVALLLAFAVVLGFWALVQIRKKLVS